MKTIELTRNQVAIVDDEDYERLMKHSWACIPAAQTSYAGRKGSKRRGEPRTIPMHREILRAPKNTIIDHINGNGLDNRKCNLRYVDTQHNAFNKRKMLKACTSRYKGVFQRSGAKRWTARIKYNDHHVELGEYETEDYAAAVYNFAAAVFFGEYRLENRSSDIPELSFETKLSVLHKCIRAADRRGWCISTPEYRRLYRELLSA